LSYTRVGRAMVTRDTNGGNCMARRIYFRNDKMACNHPRPNGG